MGAVGAGANPTSTVTGRATAPARLVAVPAPAGSTERPGQWPPEDGFVLVAGLQVPRGHDVTAFVEQAAQLRAAGADLLAIIDPAPPSARVNPVGAGVVLHERVGIDVMLPMETADRNLPTLQADLLGAHALGLRTVVCRTGHPRVAGDYPQPTAPWEVDSVGLIAALSGLNHGVDWRGVPTTDPTSFAIGGSISPSVSDTERELDRAQEKVRAGAHFLVTDVIYDVDGAVGTLAALRARGEQIPVIASVAPFVDVRTVEWLLHEVPGLSIPLAALAAARTARDAPERAVDAAVSAVQKLREFIAGVLVYLPAEPAAPVPAVELITALSQVRSRR
jgi:homocysteine S-methyltransferase